MSMHLVRGMSSNATKKRKKNKGAGWAKTLREHEKFLKKMGIQGNSGQRSKGKSLLAEISERGNSQATVPLSNTICSNGIRRETSPYTGNEIAGIVTTHKSNLMPIRKDNLQAAKDAANMRR